MTTVLTQYANERKLVLYEDLTAIGEYDHSSIREFEGEKFFVTGKGEILSSDTSFSRMAVVSKARRALAGSPENVLGVALAVPEVLDVLINSAGVNNPLEDDQNKDIVALIVSIIGDALSRNATDIRLIGDREKNTAAITYRIHGMVGHVERRWASIDFKTLSKCCSVMLNHLATLNGGDRKGSYDDASICSATFNVPQQRCRVRYHHMPSAKPRGLVASLRLIPVTDGKVRSLSDLRYSADEIRHILPMFKLSNGLVLFTGPTGHGKSSMMAAGIITIPENRDVLTLEDPVEVEIPNAYQFSVTSDFDESSKSLLRMDPDVVAVGEIRDYNSLDNAIKNASTGHLVMSTLHTNGTVQTIARLYDMKGDPNRLATPGLLRAIFANRLVPEVCSHCALTVEQARSRRSEFVAADFDSAYSYLDSIREEQNIHNVRIGIVGADCRECKGIGFVGRIPVVEILIVDDDGRRFIKSSDLVGYERYLLGKGWEKLATKARRLILSGRVSPIGIDAIMDGVFEVADSYDYKSPAMHVQTSGDVSASVVAGVEHGKVADSAIEPPSHVKDAMNMLSLSAADVGGANAFEKSFDRQSAIGNRSVEV